MSLLILKSFASADTSISCEQIKISPNWHYLNLKKDICFFDEEEIDEPDFTVNSTLNNDVIGISFDKNTNVQFLPINVYESFPDLIIYGASYCRIQAVIKENFQLLNKLTHIHLSGNKIETIPGNLFEGLESLKKIFLGKFLTI